MVLQGVMSVITAKTKSTYPDNFADEGHITKGSERSIVAAPTFNVTQLDVYQM